MFPHNPGDHHHAVRRLPVSKVPPAAVEFAVELLGTNAAQLYLHRYYAPS